MRPSMFLLCVILLGSFYSSEGFTSSGGRVVGSAAALSWRRHVTSSCLTPPRIQQSPVILSFATTSTADQSQTNIITRLIADDELIAFSLKLGEIVRDSVFACAKKFQFRADQIALEIDRRVKTEVAHMMGKEEFKLLDFIFALNKIAKEKLKDVSGDDKAEYEEMVETVDTNVRSFLVDFTGKEDADAEDIEVALQDRVKERVAEVIGLPNFSLEAWAKDMDRKRQEYLVESLGQWGADRANEVTNMAMKTITGKETYEFGDLTRKLAAQVFGDDKKKA